MSNLKLLNTWQSEIEILQKKLESSRRYAQQVTDQLDAAIAHNDSKDWYRQEQENIILKAKLDAVRKISLDSTLSWQDKHIAVFKIVVLGKNDGN